MSSHAFTLPKRYLTRAGGSQLGGEVLAEAMARMAAQFKSAAGQRAEANEQSQAFAAGMREQQRMMAYQLADAVVSRPGA